MLLPWKCYQQKGREAMGALQVVAQALGVVAAAVVVVAVVVVVVVGISSLNKGVSSCSKVVHTSSHLLLPIMHPSCKVPTCHEVSAVVNLTLCTYQQIRIRASCKKNKLAI
jgi:carbohydrate-binding DOMON domain-containing protein